MRIRARASPWVSFEKEMQPERLQEGIIAAFQAAFAFLTLPRAMPWHGFSFRFLMSRFSGLLFLIKLPHIYF
jgi:hypothetical protein